MLIVGILAGFGATLYGLLILAASGMSSNPQASHVANIKGAIITVAGVTVMFGCGLGLFLF